MDSSSKIHKNMSSSDDVMLALDNLSLNEVRTNEALCLQKCIATEGFHPNPQPDIIANKTSKTKPSVNMLNERTSQTKDCALTILDDSCCPNANSNLFLNSTYVIPDDMASSLRDSVNTKIDFVPRRNSHSNSHQQPNSSDCVITLYESSESDTSINDSESSDSETSLLHSENSDGLDCKNENELSYTIKRTSLASEGESTEEYSNDSEDSSDSDDSRDMSNESEDSSDSDSVSINDDSDEEPNPSHDEESEDSDEDSSEDKPDSDDESEPDSEDDSDESDELYDDNDDDRSVDLDEASESSSESSDDSD